MGEHLQGFTHIPRHAFAESLLLLDDKARSDVHLGAEVAPFNDDTAANQFKTKLDDEFHGAGVVDSFMTLKRER